MKIITNNVPRKLKYGYEMPQKFKSDFDYIKQDDFEFHDFVEYRGQWFDFNETMAVPDDTIFIGWHSCTSDSYFSGHVFKLVDNDTVIVGRFYS